jgi:hypothetical protein
MGIEDEPTAPQGGSPGPQGGSPQMPAGIGRDTTRDRPEGFFITPDTAPPGLSVVRPRWIVPLLLGLFAASAAGIDHWILPMSFAYGRFPLDRCGGACACS